jgi:hypothetical protein
MSMRKATLSAMFTVACASTADVGTEDAALEAAPPGDSGVMFGDALNGPDSATCPASPLPKADPSQVQLAPAFAGLYDAYILGPPPGGQSATNFMPGAFVSYNDPNTLVLLYDEPNVAPGQVWTIPISRDSCGHIIGYAGTAKPVAVASHPLQALAYGPKNILFLLDNSPNTGLEEIVPGGTASSYNVDLTSLGYSTSTGNSALVFVPSNLQDPGGLRILDWSGNWWSAAYAADSTWYDVTALTQTATLAQPCGGCAVTSGVGYVPAGSPGFPNQSILVGRYDLNSIVAYDVDGSGNPIASTERPFYSRFYSLTFVSSISFEPTAGDFLMSGLIPTDNDQGGVYVIQGFVPPPPPPPPK